MEEEVREDWALPVEKEKPETEEGVVEELKRRMQRSSFSPKNFSWPTSVL